jgi:hypothetical protein
MQTIQQLRDGDLKGVKSITLSCGLSEFPLELFELEETLEILDLSENNLSSLPVDFGRFKSLKIAFFSKNNFAVFPSVLCDCPSLTMISFRSNRMKQIPEDSIPIGTRWLILTDNLLEELPKSIGSCVNLQKVALAGNRLRELPDEMQACQKIELLRISANSLKVFPSCLLSLPRLSWLAFAGNPCSIIENTVQNFQRIPWEELEVLQQLGEGASGVISKAIWKSEETKEVAVKVFKGEVTSDGLPEDEMRLCMAAGLHENLVLIIGEVVNHPDNKKVLLMELISSEYGNLGNTPSFESCTRDVFPLESFFSMAEILNIGMSVVSAMVHLHEKGIMHGDLYAHNTMVDSIGNALLGDFGAATMYDKNSDIAAIWERFDVRAIGCLLDDLLPFVPSEEKETEAKDALEELRDKCLLPTILERPDTLAVYRQLIQIKDNIRLKYS